MTNEGITSIGSFNGFGSTGFYDPTMMSLNGYGGYGMSNPMYSSMMMNPMMFSNPMMLGGFGNPDMMNQYTDTLKQIYSAQNEIQKMNIQQASDLHEAKEKAQLHNSQVHDDTFVENVLKMGEFQDSVRGLYDAIRDGNGNETVKRFYTLRQEILNKYGDKFNDVNGAVNKKGKLDHMICTLYSEYGKGYANDGSIPDLMYDIRSHGENYFWNGFYSTFMGNKNHSKMTGEEQLNQMFGTEIQDKSSKEKARYVGTFGGHIGEGLAATAAGAGAGAATWTLKKLLTPDWLTKAVPEKIAASGVYKAGGKLGTFLRGGAIIAGLLDIGWQMTRT